MTPLELMPSPDARSPKTAQELRTPASKSRGGVRGVVPRTVLAAKSGEMDEERHPKLELHKPQFCGPLRVPRLHSQNDPLRIGGDA